MGCVAVRVQSEGQGRDSGLVGYRLGEYSPQKQGQLQPWRDESPFLQSPRRQNEIAID